LIRINKKSSVMRRFSILAWIVLQEVLILFHESRVVCRTNTITLSSPTKTLPSISFLTKTSHENKHDPKYDSFLSISRGGASKSKTKKQLNKKLAKGKSKVGATSDKDKKSVSNDLLAKYKAVLPLTRIYITMVVITTFIGMILGEESQPLLALDPSLVIYSLQLWRPFTAACFLGPPSIGWLMSTYYLFEYGSNLERAFGTAQHCMFLIGQIFLLSLISSLLGVPFFANSVITAMLHVLSRSMPKQQVKWLIFTVPYWTLPYGLLASDVLQSGSPASALPHILGILSGHFYFFHKFVWPKVGGVDWYVAPNFLVSFFNPDRIIAKKKEDQKKQQKSRGKGRKLSGK